MYLLGKILTCSINIQTFAGQIIFILETKLSDTLQLSTH